MEKSASTTIVQGTLFTSAASAFITGLYGITARHQNYGLLAGAAAINSGVTAVTFFTIREFAITPLLVYTLPWPQYARRRRELGVQKSADKVLQPTDQPSWSDLRKHKTLDTGISGVLTGGLLRGWKSGPRAVLPGALTAGAVCTVLQLAYNELGILRLKYVYRHTEDYRRPPLPVAVVPKVTIPEQILRILGMQPVSDDEYLTKLRNTRNTHLKRIEDLQRQLEEEEKQNKTEQNA